MSCQGSALRPFLFMPASAATWDSSLLWDTPSAAWDGGAPQPPVKPKKKPFRRAPKPENQPEPIPTNTMPTFKYNVAPKSSGGFTTRAVRGNPADQTALLAMIASETGTTPAQSEAVLRAFFNKVLLCATGCDWSPDFLGLINFRPTSGGSSTLPDGFHNADDINADVALSFTAETIRQWRSTLSLESMGEVGKVTPVIESVIRQSDKAVDKYTPGGLIELRGEYMNLNPTQVTQGVFLKPVAGAEVRVAEYAGITPTSIIILVPAALSGALTVRIATFINGSVRSFTYTNSLTTP